MKSILPAELESKRVEIAKSHNLRCVCLLGVLFVGVFLIAAFRSTQPTSPTPALALLCFLPLLLVEAYGIYRIIQHDNELCRQLGYMCPYCQKPLYEARAYTWINGLCPKCRKSVIA